MRHSVATTGYASRDAAAVSPPAVPLGYHEPAWPERGA